MLHREISDLSLWTTEIEERSLQIKTIFEWMYTNAPCWVKYRALKSKCKPHRLKRIRQKQLPENTTWPPQTLPKTLRDSIILNFGTTKIQRILGAHSSFSVMLKLLNCEIWMSCNGGVGSFVWKLLTLVFSKHLRVWCRFQPLLWQMFRQDH